MLGESLNNLPPLPVESRRLIAVFLDVDQNIEDLAAELNKDFFDTIAELSQPAVRAWINAINTLRNSERRERALCSLDAVLTKAHDQATVRRAATRILCHLERTHAHRPPKSEPENPRTQVPDPRAQAPLTHDCTDPAPLPTATNAEPRTPNADQRAPNLIRNHQHDLTNAQCPIPTAHLQKQPPPEAFAPGGVSLLSLSTPAPSNSARGGVT